MFKSSADPVHQQPTCTNSSKFFPNGSWVKWQMYIIVYQNEYIIIMQIRLLLPYILLANVELV